MKTGLLTFLILFTVTAFGQTQSKDEKAKDGGTEELKLNEAYFSLIKKADFEFSCKQYDEAKTHYLEALEMKPNETYPKGQIEMIQRALSIPYCGSCGGESREYMKILEAADRCLIEGNYVRAKEYYRRATVFVPNHSYPKEKIIEIDSLIAVQQNINQEYYLKAINKGDSLVKLRNYSLAINWYENASAIMPNEILPKTKLAEANALEEARADKVIADMMVQEADTIFSEKKFAEARDQYKESLTYYSNNAYAKERIQQIDSILYEKNGQVKAQEYLELIQEADTLFKIKDFQKAKEFYIKALEIKQGEPYPRAKLAEIEVLLKENK